MRPSRILAPTDATETFDQAVHDRALAVITTQQGHDWQTFKARFLERDPRGRFVVLDYQSVNGEELPQLTNGQCVGISFRQHSRKILFATVVQARGHFVLDDRTSVPAIRYRWPETITELQRRAYYRTPVPEGMSLLASMWPGGVAARAAAQPETLQVLTGELADLSCGGALLRLHQPVLPGWANNVLLGVQLQLPDGRAPITLDGRIRETRPGPADAVLAAIQFVGLELTVDGRVVLGRLANSVQRLYRLGMRPNHNESNSNHETNAP